MLRLDFSTDNIDSTLKELAEAYWALDDDGQWKSKVAAIERKFGVKQGQTKQQVAGICVAIATVHNCDTCSRPFHVRARADFEGAQKIAYRRARGFNADLVCARCEDEKYQAKLAALVDEQNRMRLAAAAAARATDLKIENWLGSLANTPLERSYQSMTLREAFLLDGLLRYAGDAWHEHQLEAWSANRLELCDLEVDIRHVYRELHAAGWLMPHPNSPTGAFTLGSDDSVVVDELRVDWVVAADVDGLPYQSLLDFANAVQRHATSAELYAIWQWVGLCELRAHFATCYEECHFRSRGWTAAVHNSVIRLLDECSLGVAKTVMYKSFNYLAIQLQKRQRPAAHIYNMLPGNMLETADYWRSRGWQFKSWRPLSSSIYSRHLFNRVMGGGEECYDKVTGSSLKQPDGDALALLT